MHDHRRSGAAAAAAEGGRPARGAVGKQTLTQALAAEPAPPGALPAPVRAKMESYFQADFSRVSVREDDRARQLGALAYAQGDQLVFQPGAYDPHTRRGQELIGHELAHVVQQRAGRAAAPAGGEAPVQCYRVVEDGRIHLSEQRTMFVHAGGAGPNKAFYARPEALQRSQAALAAAGSFIHLQAASIDHGFAKIEPRFVGPGAQHGRVYTATEDAHHEPLATQGARMGMAADCNNAARMVMGIMHAPDNTDGAPAAAAIERPVVSLGGAERVLAPAAAVPGAKGAHERAALTALTTSLREYRDVVQGRDINATHPGSVVAFLAQTQTLAGPHQAAWHIVGSLRAQHPALYADFTRWAGIDAAIAPEVGDALVAWRLENDATAVNARAYTAMVDVLRDNIESEQKRGAMTAALGQRIAVQAAARVQAVQQEAADQAILLEQAADGANAALANRKAAARARIQSRVAQLANLDADLARLRDVRDRLAAFDGGNAQALAAAALAALGVAADTPWLAVTNTMNRSYGEDDDGEITLPKLVLGATADRELTGALSDNDLWNKHWGGVVMTEDGGDYVTLENDASTAPEHGAVNAEWRFTMYGTRRPGQSFHDANEASGDFGPRASTVRFRAPQQAARPVPAQTPAERGYELARAEQQRQAEAQAREAQAADLRKKGIPSGLTLRPYSCGAEATREDRRDHMDDGGGGPPALFKAMPGAAGAAGAAGAIHADPALEAEADAHGAAAAQHEPREPEGAADTDESCEIA